VRLVVPHRVRIVATQVFLHIGPPKTGTTYIQEILWSNTEQLRKAGVVLPFKNAWCHRFVSRTLRGDPQWTNRRDSMRWNWDCFVDYVHSSPHSVLLSAEDLTLALPPHVTHAIESLSPTTVHVIATARDLGRQLPSLWQNSLKNGRVWTLENYVSSARDERSDFWRAQDVPAVLRRWLEHIPVHRVHLVTVPRARASAELLWTRFASVIGVDADAVRLPTSMSNVSLGAVQAEVLRKLYVELGSDRSERLTYWETVRSELLPVLGGSGDRAHPIRLPAEFRPWVDERGQRMLVELQGLGVDVRGEWDDLVADWPTTAEEAVSSEEELEVALKALGRILVRADHLRRERV
jgi:hypothetical protein